MPEVPSAPDVARRVADALEAAGVDYAIGGAIAYGYHGPPRATNDVDLTLFADGGELETGLDTLAGAGVQLDRASPVRSWGGPRGQRAA